MYVRKIEFKTKKKDGDTFKVVVLSLMMEPFSKDLCKSFAPGAVSKLFKQDGTPADDMLQIVVGAHAPLLLVKLSTAPDLGRPTLALDSVELVKRLAVRRDKETPQYSATIKIEFSYPDAANLLLIANALSTQFFVEMEQLNGNLYDGQDEPTLAEQRELAVDPAND